MKRFLPLLALLFLLSCNKSAEKGGSEGSSATTEKAADEASGEKTAPEEAPAEEASASASQYPFGYDLSEFSLLRRSEGGGGDCYGVQCTFGKDNVKIVADTNACGEYHATYQFFLVVDDEIKKYHRQYASVDFEAKEGEGNYLGEETCLDLESGVESARKGRMGSTEFAEMTGEFAEETIDNLSERAAALQDEMVAAGIPMASYFICYTENNGASPDLMIAFRDDGKALYAKYAGMKSILDLRLEKENMETGGAYPVGEDHYTELDMNKENGTYVLTHSGNWDYAEYTRGKDGKVFNFTINHDKSVGGDGYVMEPCIK